MTTESKTTTPYLNPGLPAPHPAGGMDAPYWEGAAAHELRVQLCGDCNQAQWPPEEICSACHSFNRQWVTAAGTGTVFAWTRVWHPVHPALSAQGPYVVVVVELTDYAVRTVGNLLGDPLQTVAIGMPVHVAFEDNAGGYTLVQWKTTS